MPSCKVPKVPIYAHQALLITFPHLSQLDPEPTRFIDIWNSSEKVTCKHCKQFCLPRGHQEFLTSLPSSFCNLGSRARYRFKEDDNANSINKRNLRVICFSLIRQALSVSQRQQGANTINQPVFSSP